MKPAGPPRVSAGSIVRNAAGAALIAVFGCVLAAGCGADASTGSVTAQGAAPEARDRPLDLGFLAFGDSGLHYDYVKKGTPAPTLEQFIAKHRRYWIEDRRPAAEFAPPPAYFLQKHGSFVMASGMYPVASAMKRHCRNVSCEFALMLGDNIYPDGAAANKHDGQRFRSMFSEPFGDMGRARTDYRIYVTLGNHDWHTSREGAMAEVGFLENNPPFHMNGNVYRVIPPAGGGQVELFVIDTTVLLAGETVMAAELNLDGSEAPADEIKYMDPWAGPATARERVMAEWLERSLQTSAARWKFVVGHHPIWSAGGFKFEQARVLRRLLLPALCRYADAYFAGHDHTLELHEDLCEPEEGQASRKPLLQIVSGAASKQRGVNTAFMLHQSQKYSANHAIWAKGMVWGFTYIRLRGDSATVSMYSTPNSGSGEAVLEFSHRFTRRSGQPAQE